MKKVYFAGSIRGGRQDENLYREAIEYIKMTDIVLTEHVGDLSLNALETTEDRDTRIYLQDTGWLKECDLVIAECTHPSLGVGYELAYAEKLGKPCHVLYRPKESQLSAMIKGNAYFHVYDYDSLKDLAGILDDILK